MDFSRLSRGRILIIAAAVIISLLMLIGFFVSDDSSSKKDESKSTTTTTTLPEKDAQACEYLTKDALAVGGLVPDVDPIISDATRRCTYENVHDEVNYITLYIDLPSQCDLLIADAKDKSSLPSVAEGAVYYADPDPTIIVSQKDRCFWLQSARAFITKENLENIAKYITDTFIAVDATTTSTTSSVPVIEDTTGTVLPGQVTATSAPTTVPAS